MLAPACDPMSLPIAPGEFHDSADAVQAERCRDLWLSVLLQAYSDVLDPTVKPANLQTVCDLIGLDVGYVNRLLEQRRNTASLDTTQVRTIRIHA